MFSCPWKKWIITRNIHTPHIHTHSLSKINTQQAENITTNINNYPFANESRVFFIHYHPSHQHAEKFSSPFPLRRKNLFQNVHTKHTLECMTNVGVHWMHFIPVSTSSFWLNIIHTNMHGHTKQGRKRDYFITLYTNTRSDVCIVKQIIIWRVCIFVLRFLFIFLYIHTQHFYISSSSHGIM